MELVGCVTRGVALDKWFIGLGIVLLVLGVLLHVFPSQLSWFGRLPGDIRVESERGGFYFPLLSMLLLSVVLTILLNLWRR